jgi:hypothetical protein
MTAADKKRALSLIDAELPRVLDKREREKIGDCILGALIGSFLIAPWPSDDEEDASRAQLGALVPGIFMTATKGHS